MNTKIIITNANRTPSLRKLVQDKTPVEVLEFGDYSSAYIKLDEHRFLIRDGQFEIFYSKNHVIKLSSKTFIGDLEEQEEAGTLFEVEGIERHPTRMPIRIRGVLHRIEPGKYLTVYSPGDECPSAKSTPKLNEALENGEKLERHVNKDRTNPHSTSEGKNAMKTKIIITNANGNHELRVLVENKFPIELHCFGPKGSAYITRNEEEIKLQAFQYEIFSSDHHIINLIPYKGSDADLHYHSREGTRFEASILKGTATASISNRCKDHNILENNYEVLFKPEPVKEIEKIVPPGPEQFSIDSNMKTLITVKRTNGSILLERIVEEQAPVRIQEFTAHGEAVITLGNVRINLERDQYRFYSSEYDIIELVNRGKVPLEDNTLRQAAKTGKRFEAEVELGQTSIATIEIRGTAFEVKEGSYQTYFKRNITATPAPTEEKILPIDLTVNQTFDPARGTFIFKDGPNHSEYFAELGSIDHRRDEPFLAFQNNICQSSYKECRVATEDEINKHIIEQIQFSGASYKIKEAVRLAVRNGIDLHAMLEKEYLKDENN